MKTTGKKVEQFKEITIDVLQTIQLILVRCYQDENKGEAGAIFVQLIKESERGGEIKIRTEFSYMSESHNEELYRVIPPFVKQRIEENRDKIYIMFFGWDSLSAGYMLSK